MYVESYVPECDFTKRVYPSVVKGAYVVVRGETGRYCAVMYVGPEYIAERGITPISREDAFDLIEKEGGYADF